MNGPEFAPVDISKMSPAELRAIATRNFFECCDDCRALLREQLEDEEQRKNDSMHRDE